MNESMATTAFELDGYRTKRTMGIVRGITVRSRSIVGTIVQQPYEFGHQSIKAMAQILGGDRSIIPPTKQIFVPTRVINSGNVDAFTQELNQLRGRS